MRFLSFLFCGSFFSDSFLLDFSYLLRFPNFYLLGAFDLSTLDCLELGERSSIKLSCSRGTNSERLDFELASSLLYSY